MMKLNIARKKALRKAKKESGKILSGRLPLETVFEYAFNLGFTEGALYEVDNCQKRIKKIVEKKT